MELHSWFVLNVTTLCFLTVNLVGNLLVLIVLFKVKTLRNVTSCMLISLAFGDILLGISILSTVASSFHNRLNTPQEWTRKMKFYGNAIVCAFTLIAIAVERYLAVMKPFYHKVHVTKKWAWKSVAAVWLISLVFTLPGFLLHPPRGKHHNSNLENASKVQYNVTKQRSSQDPLEDVRFGYEITMVCSFTVLPALIMSILYGRIIYRVWLKPDSQGTNSAIVKARRKMTKLLLVVTIAFYLCWWPVLLYMVKDINSDVKNWMMLFPLLSTCLNPIIYSLHSASFRQGIRSICCACTCYVSRRVCAEHIVERESADRNGTATFCSNNNLNMIQR